MSMNSILEQKLKQRSDVSDHEWSIWEHKTLNTHRAVLVWEPEQAPPHYSKISETIREKVASLFKRTEGPVRTYCQKRIEPNISIILILFEKQQQSRGPNTHALGLRAFLIPPAKPTPLI